MRSSASSRHERRRRASAKFTRNEVRQMERELAAIEAPPDDQIDLSDIPEVTDWTGVIRNPFYRPIKKRLTIRIDADVLAWLKKPGPGYQSRINGILRKEMISKLRRKAS